ncbi:TPA_asm: coat protein [ssRNA phage Gerhypos.1_40]|jgi:hypothetical protein|uniref:Coat protein n=2 Tax=Leviviricetes TaxID=2842243 RepID=A0A8S5L3N9_9VIRU|nr:coat protein [ssRNA phage Gerhypos.1_40]QDH89711.1 MAG: hypothetical protein H1Bulk30206_000002 [Leviviridae sp.]DAD52123.1 TPA_asm: coat protein [ssRNA phage Gerhypos.1_40]
MSITLNSKVFAKTSNVGPTSILLTTRSRGITLPDTILLDHRTKKNPVEAGSVNAIHKISIQRTFINADGVVKVGGVALTFDIPDDMDQTNIDAMYADMKDYQSSAMTERTANTAALLSGVIE